MRKRDIMFVGLIIALDVAYISSFVTACIYTVPSPEDARVRVTNGFMRYYARETGTWTPFERYHTKISGGYYALNWRGEWIYHAGVLELGGFVEECIRYDWETK